LPCLLFLQRPQSALLLGQNDRLILAAYSCNALSVRLIAVRNKCYTVSSSLLVQGHRSNGNRWFVHHGVCTLTLHCAIPLNAVTNSIGPFAACPLNGPLRIHLQLAGIK